MKYYIFVKCNDLIVSIKIRGLSFSKRRSYDAMKRELANHAPCCRRLNPAVPYSISY